MRYLVHPLYGDHVMMMMMMDDDEARGGYGRTTVVEGQGPERETMMMMM